MKLTTDYDRDQQRALRRRNQVGAQELPDKCPCEFLIERILQGESPAQIHRWAIHSQPPKFLKQLIVALSPPSASHSSLTDHSQFSHSATQLWPPNPGAVLPNVGGQFGQFSFDSLERSNKGKVGQGCDHLALFLAILSAERGGGYFTLLHSWGIPIWNVRNGRNQGPLHLAVQRNSVNCVQELLQLKPKKQSAEEDGQNMKNGKISPIHLAASLRSAKILKLLLDSLEGEEKLEAMVDEEGMNPLHHAAGAGSEQCCELLLGPTIGLPVDLRDNLGRTALHLAAMFKGASNVVRLLMAKKSIGATTRDHQGLTPVHVAIITNNWPVLEALLEGMSRNGTAQQIFDNDSRTPLHYAALYDRTEMAKLLVAKTGASNKTRDRFNATPAHYAAQCASFETFAAILGGEDKDNEEGEGGGGGGHLLVDNEGRTPLMWAIIGQNEQMVRKMLANKLESNRLLASRDNFRRNCLHLAALTGGMEMCKLLVEANSTLSLEIDEKGATAEHLAAGQGNSELVLWFGYQRGHLPPPLDELDRTPFFYACLGGQVSTIKAMLRSLHIEPTQIDQLGRTALHCAVISGSLNSVKALIECKLNFDPNLSDNNEKSAFDLAKQLQLVDILRYFEEKE